MIKMEEQYCSSFFREKKENRPHITKEDTIKYLLRRTGYECTLHGVNWANHSLFHGSDLCNTADKKNERQYAVAFSGSSYS